MEQVIESKISEDTKNNKTKQNPVGKIFAGIDWVFEKLNVALMMFLVLAVIVTVVLRYFFNISFIWAEEMILFTFIATTYFGVVVCVKEDEHIAIDFFVNRLPAKAKLVLETLISIIGIITLLWIAKVSLSWIETVGSTLSSGMKLPYKYVYSWMPFSFTVCAVYELKKAISRWFVEKEVSN